MPSPVIEQVRQQFYASRGINDSTPISEADAPALIDQWEQYLWSVAAGSGGGGGGYGTPSYGTPSYVPPGQRYVTPPQQGRGVTVFPASGGGGPRVVAAPAYTGNLPSSGYVQNAPPPRR